MGSSGRRWLRTTMRWYSGKREQLKELKTETAGKPGGEDIVAEMEDLVQEIYIAYWDRINSTMLHFTDPRLLEWRVAGAARYDLHPRDGGRGESIYIKRTPVTNGEYAEYVEATGAAVPSNWVKRDLPCRGGGLPGEFRLL